MEKLNIAQAKRVGKKEKAIHNIKLRSVHHFSKICAVPKIYNARYGKIESTWFILKFASAHQVQA